MNANLSVISGVVCNPNGQPVEDARVYFIAGPVPLSDMASLTDSKGKFTLSAPVTGIYKIECYADGFDSTSVSVEVRKDEDAQVEIRLKK